MLSGRSLYFIIGVAVVSMASAQEEAEYIHHGNKLFHSGMISESAAAYTHALELNPTNRKASFNLGNALYRNAMLLKEGKVSIPGNINMTGDSLSNLILDKAAENFAVVANSVSDKDTLHRAWHNIGNCYLQKKDYKQAVEAYKKSLKFDSKDEETRYNLAYALKHLPKEDKKSGTSHPKKHFKKEDREYMQC